MICLGEGVPEDNDRGMEHHVYFWLKEENKNEADRAAFEQGLDALLKIETIASGMWGAPSATPERPVTDKSFDYAISLRFDSIEQHNIYQDHPEHHVFVDAFKDLWAAVKVMDVG
ncbi:MAG: Dabb family protein [Akkermansiaceae bacterium]|nr:Dabb family protein [Akkermansiaceae bacterium]